MREPALDSIQLSAEGRSRTPLQTTAMTRSMTRLKSTASKGDGKPGQSN